MPPRPCSARYRGGGTDLSKVADYERSPSDSGSPEVQIARMSARVLQLTRHLAEHKKDYSTRRGLLAILSQRKQMMLYLQVGRLCGSLWVGRCGWVPFVRSSPQGGWMSAAEKFTLGRNSWV